MAKLQFDLDERRLIPLPADYQIEFMVGRRVITSQAGVPRLQFDGTSHWHGSFTPVPVNTLEVEAGEVSILGFLSAADRGETGWFLMDVAQPRINVGLRPAWRKCVDATPLSVKVVQEGGFSIADFKLGDAVSLIRSEDLADYPVTRTVAAIDTATATLTFNYPLPGEIVWTGKEDWQDGILWINRERPLIRAVFNNPVLNWTSSGGFMQLATQGWTEDITGVVRALRAAADQAKANAGSSDAVFVSGEGGGRPRLLSGDALLGLGGG